MFTRLPPAAHQPFATQSPTPHHCPINVPPVPYLVPYLICSSHSVSTKIHPQTSKYTGKRHKAVSCNKAKPPALCPAVSTIEPVFPCKFKGFRLFPFALPYPITYFPQKIPYASVKLITLANSEDNFILPCEPKAELVPLCRRSSPSIVWAFVFSFRFFDLLVRLGNSCLLDGNFLCGIDISFVRGEVLWAVTP